MSLHPDPIDARGNLLPKSTALQIAQHLEANYGLQLDTARHIGLLQELDTIIATAPKTANDQSVGQIGIVKARPVTAGAQKAPAKLFTTSPAFLHDPDAVPLLINTGNYFPGANPLVDTTGMSAAETAAAVQSAQDHGTTV